MIDWPVPAVLPPVPPPVPSPGSLSMWNNIAAILHGQKPGIGEVLVPRTLPVRTLDDVTPYHWVRDERGRMSLRKGAPPAAVKQAAAEFANGNASLDDFLDRIGVPRS